MLCISVVLTDIVVFIEGNPFEKGLADARPPLSQGDTSPPRGESPSNSLPKTFGCFSVSDMGHMSHIRYAIILKVFGKGFGEEPFLRKVCPDRK